jgi:hypothetical protein
MAYDVDREALVLFGGYGPSGLLNDTWEFDGTSWQRKVTTLAPQKRAGALMVYDAKRRVNVLFGGNVTSRQQWFNDTWEWDGNRWLRRPTPSAPSPRTPAAFVYDEARKVCLLFGGGNCSRASGKFLGDTWIFDGTRWRGFKPTASPAPRNSAAMTYDTRRNVVVLFGGYDGRQRNDLWEWNGRSWTERMPRRSDRWPQGTSGHAMAYDRDRGVVVLFGGYRRGDAWEWNGDAWKAAQDSWGKGPTARYAMSACYTPQGILVFGGVQPDATYLDELWARDRYGWRQIQP